MVCFTIENSVGAPFFSSFCQWMMAKPPGFVGIDVVPRPEDKLSQYGKGEIVEGDGVRQDGPGYPRPSIWGAHGGVQIFGWWELIFLKVKQLVCFKEFSSKKV